MTKNKTTKSSECRALSDEELGHVSGGNAVAAFVVGYLAGKVVDGICEDAGVFDNVNDLAKKYSQQKAGKKPA
jgi:hypothetical protein